MRPESLFSKAFETARRALRDLEPDQVPSDLVPVLRHSGRLTPPLADRLLKAIEQYDWLREQAIAGWLDGAEALVDGHKDLPSALLLLRPTDWVGRLLTIAAALGAERAERDASDLKRRLDEARRRLAATKRKLKSDVAALEKRESELRAELVAAREPDRRAARQSETGAAALDRARADHERQVGELTASIDGLRAERNALADIVRAQRRDIAVLAASSVDPAGVPDPADPLAIAVHLDWLAQISADVPEPRDQEVVAHAVELPAGVAPDGPAAIAWAVGQRVSLMIDGWNVGLKLAPDDPPTAFRRTVDVANRLARLGVPGFLVSVVFDSKEDAKPVMPGLAEVRFVDGSADDVLVATTEVTDRALVVTSDRRLRERVEAAGGLALWSEALVQWSRRR